MRLFCFHALLLFSTCLAFPTTRIVRHCAVQQHRFQRTISLVPPPLLSSCTAAAIPPRQNTVSLFASTKDDDDDADSDGNSSSSSLPSSSLTTSEIAPQLESLELGRKLLVPLAQVLEDSTDGWALEYADLSPETETTPVGISFLATNAAYTICGLLLVQNGNVLLGVLTELASVASFAYHYTQLKLGKNQPLVRVALLVDYVVAAATLMAALVYILQVGVGNVPWQGVVASVLAVVFLFLSWVWEEGLPYVINHGMWHLLGAYAGFIIGQAHYDSILQ